jgi:hypothetical protein
LTLESGIASSWTACGVAIPELYEATKAFTIASLDRLAKTPDRRFMTAVTGLYRPSYQSLHRHYPDASQMFRSSPEHDTVVSILNSPIVLDRLREDFVAAPERRSADLNELGSDVVVPLHIRSLQDFYILSERPLALSLDLAMRYGLQGVVPSAVKIQQRLQ